MGSAWAKLSSHEGRGTVCPALRLGSFDYFAVLNVEGMDSLDGRCVGLHAELRPRGRTYRAAAVLAFICKCGLCGSGRGIAAISRFVYECCGLAKICSVTPHSMISPS